MGRCVMKIYFAGSIRGGRGDAPLYHSIISHLQQYGTVLTEHLGDPNLTASGEARTTSFIHDRDISWLEQAQMVVAEVTTASMGVGYELGYVAHYNKTAAMPVGVLCLFHPVVQTNLSAMVDGSRFGFDVRAYNSLDEACSIVDSYVAQKMRDPFFREFAEQEYAWS